MAFECVAERKGLVVTHQHCPDRPYLELQVPDDADVVRSIECLFVGRDQGWYIGGIPEASYAWVDATIERPSGRNLLGSLSVQCTEPGSLDYKVYNRRWDTQSKKVQRVWHDLQPGDVVQMIPRANYPGWTCLVREACINIIYNASQKEASPAGGTTPSSRGETPSLIYPCRLDSENHMIRMLLVEPALSADEPLICSLTTTRLPPGRPFDALSYCWGAGSSMDVLNVNGQDLSVSSSVTAALRRLRHEKHEVAIWIDQICINQHDVDERDEQIRLMAEIYSSAAQVHVWLGEGDVATWTALRIIRDSFNVNYKVCPGGAACKCHDTAHALEVETFNSRQRHGKPSFKLMHEVLFAHVKNEHGLPSCLDPFLFEAENGSIGICPWMAEKGDVVVILYGGKVPYLLRPNRNVDVGINEVFFQFIGECYVMGAMDDMWFKRQVEEGSKPQMFTII
ncbi:hypothetical protein N8I77_009852 [Diaporthe amygdali]|uniref:Heterokaryon incompatibility domain-containing protein n=1 Tax=Phomopsis amygdali TaxID=1214568 RepID=A0AAD9SAQ6_PHOAM|nr:hypothetical protein N8I77_009852 [Diaporthe amygdali]